MGGGGREGHSQESPQVAVKAARRLWTKERGCHLMEKSDIMAHWLRACWIPGDVLLDSHNSPVREVESRAPRHKKMKPRAQGPSRAGFEPGFAPVWPAREPRASLYILTLVQEEEDPWTGPLDSLLMSELPLDFQAGPGKKETLCPSTPWKLTSCHLQLQVQSQNGKLNFLWSPPQSSQPRDSGF